METSVPCRVLIVEDNADTLHTFAHLLRAEGYSVQLAVCTRMKSDPELRDACVIAVTAYGHRLRSLAAGCELHVVKPVEPAYLHAG